jgi:hypothetical protein
LYGNAILPEANQQMHIAIAAFIQGSALPFSMARDCENNAHARIGFKCVE